MLDGLIICVEKKLFDELTLNLSNQITVFEYAKSVESAKSLANVQTFDYVLAADPDCHKLIECLEQLLQLPVYGRLPVLCATSTSTPELRKILWEKGIKDIIHLPISTDELNLRLERFLRDFAILNTDERNIGMQGKLEDYNLIDIVQTLEQNQKTGVLTLYHGRDEGRIWFKDGVIYDSQVSSFENLEAIFKLMTWMQGDFTISFVDEDYERKIFVDNQQILLDALQHMDMRTKILESLPSQDESLLISPETDMDVLEATDLNYLRFFQGGQKISAFLSAFDDNEIILLEKIRMFLDKKILMTRDEFDSHTTETEREMAEAGFKNVFKKLFRGREEDIKKRKKKSEPKTTALEEIHSADEEDVPVPKEHSFAPGNIDFTRLKKLINKL
jgi:CheY-like chemotaxis protein